ncbi:DUF664 domain-containing protein [Streptomyces sp. NPDC090499]|uniref:mycothiol transferase n=1 Tax=Streptomyces sp. NPDC090499 TaxID=3365965 RepID=UPI0038179857
MAGRAVPPPAAVGRGCPRPIWTHSDGTIAALPLDAVGQLPVDPPKDITLHRVLTHLAAESRRHAGHADIVRELVAGAAGQQAAEEAGRGGR